MFGLSLRLACDNHANTQFHGSEEGVQRTLPADTTGCGAHYHENKGGALWSKLIVLSPMRTPAVAWGIVTERMYALEKKQTVFCSLSRVFRGTALCPEKGLPYENYKAIEYLRTVKASNRIALQFPEYSKKLPKGCVHFLRKSFWQGREGFKH